MVKHALTAREVRRPVGTFMVRAYCECGGEFVVDKVLPGYPSKYRHRCKACGGLFDSSNRYPHTVHEETG